jgi:hypothetical protein
MANRVMKDVYDICVAGISEVFHELAKSLLDQQIWWNSNVRNSQSQNAWQSSVCRMN